MFFPCFVTDLGTSHRRWMGAAAIIFYAWSPRGDRCEANGEEGSLDLPMFVALFNQVTDMLAKEIAGGSWGRAAGPAVIISAHGIASLQRVIMHRVTHGRMVLVTDAYGQPCTSCGKRT